MSARVPQALALSVSLFRQEVAVGIRIAPNPPHGSGRADLPHPALASSGDAHSTRRIGMINSGRGEPTVDEPFHSRPTNMTLTCLSSTTLSKLPSACNLQLVAAFLTAAAAPRFVF